MNIPDKLKNDEFRFVLIAPKGKAPIEKKWTKGRTFDDPEVQQHKGNIGIIGGFGNLVIIDFDEATTMNALIPLLPNTFTVQTGGKGLLHLYFITDDPGSWKALDKNKDTLFDVQGTGRQVVIPPSIHPSGKEYKVLKDIDIAYIDGKKLRSILGPYSFGALENKRKLKKMHKLSKDPQYQQWKDKVSVSEMLEHYGVDISKNPTNCPLHSSAGGRCLSFDNDLHVWNCFHCSAGGDIFNLVMEKEGCSFMPAFDIIHNFYKVKHGIKETDSSATTDQERLQFLKHPGIWQSYMKELSKKIVGEDASKHAIFLCLSSIFVKNIKGLPNLFVNARSSAGKDYICKAIYDIFPLDIKETLTKITPEGFTYWKRSALFPDWTWDGKMLYLQDISQKLIDGSTFKVMISEGSKAIIVKDAKALEITIIGKPMFMITTANSQPNNEITNRFISITLDESEKQTEQILKYQALQAQGVKKIEYSPIYLESLKELERVNVEVPWADKLLKYMPKDIRLRRYFKTMLDLVKCSASFHQHQRKRNGNKAVIAEKQDYEIMRYSLNKLRLLVPPLTHNLEKLYELCKKWHTDNIEFDDKSKLEEEKWFTAGEIHVYSMNHGINVSLKPTMYDYLKNLVSFGLLSIKHEQRDGNSRPVMVYKPTSISNTNLPEWEKLYDTK